MKNSILLFASMIALTFAFSSCASEDSLATDDQLISDIGLAAKSSVEVASLPTQITTTVEDTYFETYIEEALLARGKGYQINMEDGQQAYFDTTGRQLLARGGGGKGGHGHHGEGHEHPDAISIDSLPAIIVDYISTNYPEDTIKRAKLREDGTYWVGLESHTILVFDADGNFVMETTAEDHSCGGHGHGQDVAVEDLPTAITDYITANYPTATIERAKYKENEKYVVGVLLGDGTKKLLVFDAEGNFLFERDKKH
jgi:hypothetical protein